MKKIIYLLSTMLLALASCTSVKDFNYFQDTKEGDVVSIANALETVKIKPFDRISIIVTCKDPILSAMYNLVSTNTRLGQTTTGSGGNGSVSCYTVDNEGNIDFPILGTIHVGGLSRNEIAEKVKTKLTTSEQGIKNATVIVEYADLHVGVLGEVKSAGAISIDRDQFTILNAIEKAGDLTPYGNRKNIKVYRRHGDNISTYEMDLTNLNSLTQSPAFILQQNDVVYVEPNKVKARQSTANGNTFLTPSFWMSALTMCLSIAVLITK